MRRKGDELTLITFGQHTYSADARYALQFEDPNDWKLLIQHADERDEGSYECQVSSHPPLVLLVYLTVIGKKLCNLMNNQNCEPHYYLWEGGLNLFSILLAPCFVARKF